MPRSNNIAAIAASLSGAVIFAALVVAGKWLSDRYLTQSGAATIMFWACVAFSVVYIAPRVPAKITGRWRDAMYQDAFL